ncbi:MAG: alanine racemase [Lachnospiraceae bacterium]|nr:alanine racemase [Lachnospiraceae bacterium]
MGYIDEYKLQHAIDHNIRITVYSLDYAMKINNIARLKNKKAIIHIKIDTGMSRIGFIVNETSISDIKKIFSLDHIIVEGIYTHFAKSDITNKDATYEQLEKFHWVLHELKLSNLDIPIKHVSNSAAILDQRDCDFNMVRLGISLYGSYPSNEVSKEIKLKTALTLKTKVSNIKWIEKGTEVSYGGTYIANRRIRLATIPVGYADGFSRTQKNPQVYVNGTLLNIVGRICMDQSMFEVPDELSINIEDEVTLIGDMDGIRIGDISRKMSTIDHEILCCLTARVDRVYYTSNKTLTHK